MSPGGSFSRLDPEKPVSLSAMEVIDIALPPKTSASLHLKSTWGEILTDFDMTIRPRDGRPIGVQPPIEIPLPPLAPRSSPKGGAGEVPALAPDASMTHADIGGGGVEIRLTTVSGNIYVRKRQ